MKERPERLRQRFQEFGISGFLLKDQATIRWLSGCNAHGNAVMLVTRGSAYFVTDGRYKEHAQIEVQAAEILINNAGYYLSEIAEKQILKPAERIGFETEFFSDQEARELQELFPEVEFVPIENMIAGIAAIKEPQELMILKKVAKLTDHILEKHILPKVRVGMKENDLAAEILFQGKKHGMEKFAWETPIVLSGVRSSLIHGEASNKRIEVGDILQFDIGYVYRGYCSDLSRVVFVGRKPDERQGRIYEIVLTAQERAINAVRPGMKCLDLDKVARDFIKKVTKDLPTDNKESGFGHGLGHGIGIWAHTFPRVSIFTSGEEEILEVGNVFTIEPGVYLPGWGGMRIEDVVVVTKDGCKNLTTASKEIRIVG